MNKVFHSIKYGLWRRTVISVMLLAFIVSVKGIAVSENLQIQKMNPEKAIPANEFLNSLGVNSSINKRGENLQNTIEYTKYLGIRWFRTGYEDNVSLDDLKRLHDETNVRFSYGLLSGGNDIDRLITEASFLASEGALLAIEGANEPNNWGISYQGQNGGKNDSWLPIAHLQRDLYKAVKSTPELKDYPVFHLTENGAQTDNAGLQFLEIPKGANTLMPAGTRYADYANCHNYVSHPSWPGLHDNQTWLSADPGQACPVDGLYGNYGSTWSKHFPGYSEEDLQSLPRVTTETGIAINEKEGITEKLQACLYLNLYLSQFKRGWKYTAIYLLRTRSNEPAHEVFSFFNLDGSPKLAAHYLHNLTSVLDDKETNTATETLSFEVENEPASVHHLLLQKSNGTFELVLWGELYTGGSENVRINFAHPCKQIHIYDPTVDSEVIKTFKNTDTITLTMTDHPIVVEIVKQD